MFSRSFLTGALAFALGLGASAGDKLSSNQLKLLHDPGGWEYIKISNSDSGFQTEHTCFDGIPDPQQCSGVMKFTPHNTFVQKIHIHGQTLQRHGKYQLGGKQLALFDELGTKDGPYTLDLNEQNNHLVLQMPQVRIELELEEQYRKDRRPDKQPPD